MSRERAVNLVRGFLAKAEATDHEPEAHAFTERANKLIARWDIDESELGDVFSGPVTSHAFDLDMPAEWARPFAWAVKRIGRVYGATSVRVPKVDPSSITVRCTATQWASIAPCLRYLRVELAMALSDVQPSDTPDFIYGWGDTMATRLAMTVPVVKTFRQFVAPPVIETVEEDTEGEDIEANAEPIKVGEGAELGRLLARSVPLPLRELP